MEKWIEVSNVRFGYGDRRVLNQVTFSVGPGEFVGIIGSNGTGKSTLLRLLLGALKPDEGIVHLFGKSVGDTAALPEIGYVPQHGLSAQGGFPATAEEIVLSGLYKDIGRFRPVRRKHRAMALQALEQVNMADAAHTPVGSLSGGQLQRVLLARVLAGKPRVLMLDEPLTGIDAASSDEMYRLLRKLSTEEGKAVLMVTHDLSRASEYLDRVLCLEYGVLVEVEKDQIRHELLHRHRHPPAEALLAPAADVHDPLAPHALAPACGWPRVSGQEGKAEVLQEETGNGHL